MSKVCQITGKTSQTGNHVSHSNNRVKRKFEINLLEKRFFLEEENRWITLKVTPAGMRTINKKGLKVALADAVKNGIIEKY
ncbi:MAG TPA: 50S ribosomal protein L28 [Bacteroidales bacterium]|nr:50S ribosomal protein L28 [Bacteroidales bacterium]